MKRKTFWVVALVGLIAIGLAGTAFANEIAATVRNRFSCDAVPGELTTVSGTVTDHSWNGFTLTAGDTEYFVKTGPARIGRGMDENADGTRATVEGYTGAGTNYRFTDNLLLRLDVRWLATFFDSNGAAFCSGGCVIGVSSQAYSQVQANIGLMFRF